jgi:hypothetical protein
MRPLGKLTAGSRIMRTPNDITNMRRQQHHRRYMDLEHA